MALLPSGSEPAAEASPGPTPPAGYGAIVGGIEPCSGTVLFASPKPVGFSAGTV